MVGADPGRRLCLCELVCLHKHTHTHTYTHTFIKLFCFQKTLGDFPETEFFDCKQIALDRKKQLEFFHLPGHANHLKYEREKQNLCLSITTRSEHQSQAITTEKCTKTPSRYLQFHHTFHSPRSYSRIRCQTPTLMFDKKGIRQIAHQPHRVLPSEKYKLGNSLEIPARTARLEASHK